MSDLHRALRERTDDFRPQRTPPITTLRLRKRRRDTARLAGAAVTAALAVVAVAVLPTLLTDQSGGSPSRERAAATPAPGTGNALDAQEIKAAFEAAYGPEWQPRLENCVRNATADTATDFDWARPRATCNVMFGNAATTGVVDVRALSFAEPPTDEQVKDLVPYLGSSTDHDYAVLAEERPEPGTFLIVARAAGQGTLVSIMSLPDGSVLTTRQPPSQASITADAPAITSAFLKQFLTRPGG